MRYKEFGKTGKKVSILGFGAMRFDPKNEELAVNTVRRAVELGINYFDTAPGYCEDTSESYLGEALSSLPDAKRENIYISTKSHIGSDPTADTVLKRIEKQLHTLKRHKIEFYNMWCILDMEQFRRVMAPGGPYEGAVRAKEQGLIEHICVTAHASGEDIAAIVREGVFEGVTLGYNIVNHEYRKEGLKAAAAAGLGVVTMNPLGGGMLTRHEQMLGVLKENESDCFIAAALRFNFSHTEITVVLSGMKDPLEVEANVWTADFVEKPDPAVMERLTNKFQSLGESFCTGCVYCLEHCPENIQIHLYANLWDRVRMMQPEEARRIYKFYLTDEERWFKGKRASDCTDCGACEEFCTQKLSIREYLGRIAEFFGEN